MSTLFTLKSWATPFTSLAARLLQTAALVFVLLVGSLAGAEENSSDAGFDRVWGHAKLYENPDSFVSLFALSGRLQLDSAWFSADADDLPPGAEDNYNDQLWRRFRFGFKMHFGGGWAAAVEGEFDINNELSEAYNRLTDAYFGYSTSEAFTVKVLKQSAGFTLDGATSSKKLLAMERNSVTNNLWFTNEYFVGLHVHGTVDKRWSYRAGIFSGGNDEEFGFEDETALGEAGYFSLLSLGYNFAQSLNIDDALIRVDYVYSRKDEDDPEELAQNATRNFDHVMTLASKWENNGWGLWTDLSAGHGIVDQSDLWGLALMPYYSFNKHHQVVLRYTFLSSRDDNGVRFGRYENRIVDQDLESFENDRGNRYNEVYAGYNLFFYGHKFKWQTGLQYTTMQDDADDGGAYNGWGLSTGLRMYWY
jgi:phosphate-selective porin OprO/OprP